MKLYILFVFLSWTLLSCQLLPSFQNPNSLESAQTIAKSNNLEEAQNVQSPTNDKTPQTTQEASQANTKPPNQKAWLPSSHSHFQPKKNYVSPFGTIQIDDNEQVDKWINYFQTAGREKMALYLSRSTRYLSLMKKELREQKLPEDLVYVAMIESGFSPYARSFANAVGYWQFIEGTGRRYGLKINSYVDERRDPILATRAAARYLKDLYNVFTSWPLALASYNAGEYRVHRSVLRYYTKDFWFLSAKRSLPRETVNYVPKFMAAVQISKNPEQYGFDNIQYQVPFQYDPVPLKTPISLKKLANNLDISYKELRKFNPRYRSEYVHLYEEQSVIRVPRGQKKYINDTLLASAYMKKPPFVHSDHYWYRIKRGDTLYRLARRNKTNISTIRRMNKMSRRSVLRAGRKIKLPYYSKAKKPNKVYALVNSYTVKKGDSLSSISRKYKVSVQKIRQINNLSAVAIIHPGQILKLKSNPTHTLTGSKIVHIVQRGETLIGIAKKYQVSLSLLMKKNNLSFRSVLTAGRHITIPASRGGH